MRKRFLQLAAFVALSLSTTFAQDITVFNFDGITPTFTGGDQLVTIANPLVGATNGSATVGQLTHTGQYNDKNITVDIDPRIYPTVEMLVYVPTSTTGKATIACFNGGTQLDWYETAAIATPGTWVKITRALTFTTKITSVKIGWNRNNAISATAADNVVLYDNLVFKKTSATFLNWYIEPFTASWSLYSTWVGAPSTKTWLGGRPITTVLDSTINLSNWNGSTNNNNVVFGLTSPAITISNIDVTGLDSLKFAADFQWPYSAGENATYYNGAIPNSQKSPIVQVKNGTGDWVQLATTLPGGSWGTQTILLKNASGNVLSGLTTISLRLSHAALVSYNVDNIKVIGKLSLGTTTALANNKSDAIVIYPNPASDYIIAKGAQQVKLYNLNGKLVLTANNTERVDISALSKGIYVAKVTIGSETSVSKLTKF